MRRRKFFALATAAQATERIRVGTAICLLVERDPGPALLAVQQPVDVRADGHARSRLQLDAVLGDGGDQRRRDDARVDAHLNGLKHITAS